MQVVFPPAGRSFDGGPLQRQLRYRFVPRVAGTWEHVDRFSGETGTLTAEKDELAVNGLQGDRPTHDYEEAKMPTSSSKNRWSVLALALTALACGEGSLEPVGPTPTAIAIVSGDAQEAKAGEWLERPFVARVTDAGGDGVEGQLVGWKITSGEGILGRFPAGTPIPVVRTLYTPTDSDGRARAFFRPHAVGSSTVIASVRTSAGHMVGSPAVFETDVTVLVIELGYSSWDCWDSPAFFGPGSDCDNVRVPVATTIEWVNRLSGRASITSVSTPMGGESFDSGVLLNGDRFEFVPRVPGTWEYRDRVSRVTGTLMAW